MLAITTLYPENYSAFAVIRREITRLDLYQIAFYDAYARGERERLERNSRNSRISQGVKLYLATFPFASFKGNGRNRNLGTRRTILANNEIRGYAQTRRNESFNNACQFRRFVVRKVFERAKRRVCLLGEIFRRVLIVYRTFSSPITP